MENTRTDCVKSSRACLSTRPRFMHVILSYAVQISTILPGTSRELTAVQKINYDIMEDDISTENFNDKVRIMA